MSGFGAFQERFQRAIISGDDAILAEIVDSPHEKRDVLLGVYRKAYVLRLAECLRNDYGRLLALLGRDAFDRIAHDYVRAHPSTNANARWFGAKLPEYLANTEPYAHQPVLTDLAAIERGLADVFDAADGTRLTLEDLGQLGPEDWPGVEFSPHPVTRRANVTTNALDIWRALGSEGTAPPAVETRGDADRLVFYRPELTSMVRVMGYEEAMMWDQMSAGVAFGGLCEMVATYGGEEDAPLRAARHLKGWIEAGMLSGPEQA